MSLSAVPQFALEEMCELITDGTHFSPPSSSNGPFLYITSKNIRPTGIDLSNISYVSKETHARIYEGCPVREGDVLFVKDGVNAGTAAINTLTMPFSMLSSVALLRPSGKKLDAKYLTHWLNSPAGCRRMLRNMSGSAIRRLVLREIRHARIPVLPLPEQRRIAEVLDQAEALRAKRRAALAQLDALTQSIFFDLFGDPATNPKGWLLAHVGDVADVQGGLQVSSARKNHPCEVPYLRVANVFRGFLDLSEIKTLRATEAEISRTKLEKDDLLIVEGHGNPAEIGRGALWDGSVVGCIHQNHIIRVRFKRAQVLPLFACSYLNSPGGRRHLLRAGKTPSGLNTISVSEVRSAPVVLPPLSLQREFASRIAAVEKLKVAYRASLVTLDHLFAVLGHRAFRGEL